MPTTPSSNDISALAVPLSMRTADGIGYAVATQWTGDQMIYLIARPKSGPPVWYADTEIESATATLGG